jgi:hypothetical protein
MRGLDVVISLFPVSYFIAKKYLKNKFIFGLSDIFLKNGGKSED